MAISAKYRRHIQVAGSQYLWWVTEMLEDDFLGSLAATVASEDRQLLVRYGLSQVDDRRFIVVLGPSFRGLPGLGGPWRRFRCPQFGTVDRFAPRDVANLIAWCREFGEPATEVNYMGLEWKAPQVTAPKARRQRTTAK
jgi:hypothetical protein